VNFGSLMDVPDMLFTGDGEAFNVGAMPRLISFAIAERGRSARF
jgi:hypothetical protein